MRDLYLKRNELNRISQVLRTAKFQDGIPREQVTKIFKEQEEAYKRFKFYDNYLKIGGKIYGEQVHTKKR